MLCLTQKFIDCNITYNTKMKGHIVSKIPGNLQDPLIDEYE